jgi:alpha-L-rhamnosidase
LLHAFWTQGSYEAADDEKVVYSSSADGGKTWTEPVMIAGSPSIEDPQPVAAWQQPMISRSGRLYCLWNQETTVKKHLCGLMFGRYSDDGGKTWSKREALPEGFLGPVKNKPEIINDRLLCPSSTEVNGWKFHMEIYDLKTKQWKYVGPIEAEMAMRCENMPAGSGLPAATTPNAATTPATPDATPATTPNASALGKKEDIEAPDAGGVADKNGMHPIDCIQPSILKLKDGRLQVLMRTRNGKIATSFSSDNGDSWSKVTLLDVPNNQSGTDAVTLKDGRHVLIYNNFETLPGTKKGVRTPLSIAISNDGTHWRHALTLEDSPISQYSYPSIIQGKDGKLHVVYTWRRLRVAYKEIDIDKL